MAGSTAPHRRGKLSFAKTILILCVLIIALLITYPFIASARGHNHAQSSDGTLSSEIVELHGHKYLRLYVEDTEINSVAIPAHPRVYFEEGGKQWGAYNGTLIDPNVIEKRRLVTSTDIISLTPESSLLFRISDATPGDIVIELGGYDTSLMDDARKRGVWLWTGTITIKR